MKIVCPKCGQIGEVEVEPAIGQHVICPFCETKFCYALPDSCGCVNASKTKNIGCLPNGGCLPVVVASTAFSIVATYHNLISVFVAVTLFFVVIMICVYNRLNTRMGGQATVSDVLTRLGVGGSSVLLFALTLACVFLMRSCDDQAKEREERSKQWEEQVERDGGWWHHQTCPKCNFKQNTFIEKGRDTFDMRIRCDSCGYWMKYKTFSLF